MREQNSARSTLKPSCNRPLVVQRSPGGRAFRITTGKKTVTIGASDLDLFRQLPILEEVELRGFPLGDAALQRLASVSTLKTLVLSNAKITDQGIEGITQSTSLTSLDLSGTAITDAGLQSLSRLSSLEFLNLDQTAITGEGFEAFSADSRIGGLALTGSQFQSENVAHLVKLKNLAYLEISQCSNVTDEAVPHLSKMKGLKRLNTYLTKISEDGGKRLKAALPQLSSI